MTIADAPIKTATQSPRRQRRSIGELLAPLEKIAATSPNLVANHEAHFEVGRRVLRTAALSFRRPARRRHADPHRDFRRHPRRRTRRRPRDCPVHQIARSQTRTRRRILSVVLSGLQSDRLRGRDAVFASRQRFESRILEKFHRAGSPLAASRTAFHVHSKESSRCTPTTRATAFTVSSTARR